MAGHVPRIYLPQPLTVGHTITVPDVKRHHLATVLRISQGDEVALFNDTGFEYHARVADVTRKTLDLIISAQSNPVRESGLGINLVQSILGGDRMDYALAKAIELGVASIQPVTADNGKLKLSRERLNKKHAHWQAVVEAAAEQSGRLVCPPVAAPGTLRAALAARAQDTTGVILALQGDSALATLPPYTAFSLLIGPESGLSDTEIKLGRDNGWHTATLGPRVLRAETAGPAAIASLQAVAGDLTHPCDKKTDTCAKGARA